MGWVWGCGGKSGQSSLRWKSKEARDLLITPRDLQSPSHTGATLGPPFSLFRAWASCPALTSWLTTPACEHAFCTCRIMSQSQSTFPLNTSPTVWPSLFTLTVSTFKVGGRRGVATRSRGSISVMAARGDEDGGVSGLWETDSGSVFSPGRV